MIKMDPLFFPSFELKRLQVTSVKLARSHVKNKGIRQFKRDLVYCHLKDKFARSVCLLQWWDEFWNILSQGDGKFTTAQNVVIPRQYFWKPVSSYHRLSKLGHIFSKLLFALCLPLPTPLKRARVTLASLFFSICSFWEMGGLGWNYNAPEIIKVDMTLGKTLSLVLSVRMS